MYIKKSNNYVTLRKWTDLDLGDPSVPVLCPCCYPSVGVPAAIRQSDEYVN